MSDISRDEEDIREEMRERVNRRWLMATYLKEIREMDAKPRLVNREKHRRSSRPYPTRNDLPDSDPTMNSIKEVGSIPGFDLPPDDLPLEDLRPRPRLISGLQNFTSAHHDQDEFKRKHVPLMDRSAPDLVSRCEAICWGVLAFFASWLLVAILAIFRRGIDTLYLPFITRK